MTKFFIPLLRSLLFIYLFPTLSSAQDYDSLLNAQNYAPRLISAGIDWPAILDSVSLFYPDDTSTIREIAAAIQLTQNPEKWQHTVPEFAVFLQENAPESLFTSTRQAIIGQGPKCIPGLIALLGIDAATRVIDHPDDFEAEPAFYLTTSDLAMDLIESISGIYFFRNFSQRHFYFSDQSDAFQVEMRTTISNWHTRTQGRSKAASICFYLDSIPNLAGNRLYTVENLIKLGDTIAAIRYLTQMYKEYNMAGRSPMSIANMAAQLGVDLGSDDCMNKILNYRCTIDNGVECVWYLLKHPRSHIPFDVLAEVVATERYSRYRNLPYNRQFVWHYIFNEMAVCKNTYAASILFELLKINEVLKESSIVAYYWRQKYPQEWEAGYRVCDFALLKMIELELVTPTAELADPAARTAAIARILKGGK